MSKLNLGCGKDIREGYVNVDVSSEVGADCIMNFVALIDWPFEDNQFEEALANNSLTQILEGKDFVHVMNNLWKCVNGPIYIRVPNSNHECAFQDPMDCRRFTEQSFTYMQHDHRRYDQYGKHYGFKPFEVELISNNGIQMEFKLIPVK